MSEAKPHILSMLQRGGSAKVTVGAERRMLWYDPRIMPPLFATNFRAKWSQLMVKEAKQTDFGATTGKLLRNENFPNQSEHDLAVSQLLKDAPPDACVLVMIVGESDFFV